MTSSAFPFLDGRTSVDGPLARVPRRRTRRTGAVLEHLRRRLQRARVVSTQRDQQRRHQTDAYLDRTALSSAVWLETLARTGQR